MQPTSVRFLDKTVTWLELLRFPVSGKDEVALFVVHVDLDTVSGEEGATLLARMVNMRDVEGRGFAQSQVVGTVLRR